MRYMWQKNVELSRLVLTQNELFGREDLDAVVITTRHNTHAAMVSEALKNGKSVFVEKPLVMTRDQLQQLQSQYSMLSENKGAAPIVMVGFNRRFSPFVQKIKSSLAAVSEPFAMTMTVNAGSIPLDHWTQDPEIGGGRIIGEACHFIDLMRYLANSKIQQVQAVRIPAAPGKVIVPDSCSISLQFENGAIGVIHYLSNGHRKIPKERLEVFAEGKIFQLNNFKSLSGYGWSGFKKMSSWKQDKGQDACCAAFINALAGKGPVPIPADEIFEVMDATLTAHDLITS